MREGRGEGREKCNEEAEKGFGKVSFSRLQDIKQLFDLYVLYL